MGKEAWTEGGVYSSKPDMPPQDYQNAYDPLAILCGFYDKFQLTAVSDYLFMNGGHVIQPVSGFCCLLL